MRELTMDEIGSVSGGLFDGDCNTDLGSYLLATAGLMLVSGPLSAVTAGLSWGYSAYGLQDCLDRYDLNYFTTVDQFGCHKTTS
jgi:hypothetical protein